jgi:hypothetical protein
MTSSGGKMMLCSEPLGRSIRRNNLNEQPPNDRLTPAARKRRRRPIHRALGDVVKSNEAGAPPKGAELQALE